MQDAAGNYYTGSGTIAADYCHTHGIPYLAEAVACPWNHSFRGKVLARSVKVDFRRTMRNADFEVYVTSKFLQGGHLTNGKSVAISDVDLQLMDDTILERWLEKIQQKDSCTT